MKFWSRKTERVLITNHKSNHNSDACLCKRLYLLVISGCGLKTKRLRFGLECAAHIIIHGSAGVRWSQDPPLSPSFKCIPERGSANPPARQNCSRLSSNFHMFCCSSFPQLLNERRLLIMNIDEAFLRLKPVWDELRLVMASL